MRRLTHTHVHTHTHRGGFCCWTAKWSSVVTSAALCIFLLQSSEVIPPLGGQRSEFTSSWSCSRSSYVCLSSDVWKLKLEAQCECTLHVRLCEETKIFFFTIPRKSRYDPEGTADDMYWEAAVLYSVQPWQTLLTVQRVAAGAEDQQACGQFDWELKSRLSLLGLVYKKH